jgi:cation diffusion facilitator CzcD-associated flavoprotein CzcO
MTRPTIAVVGAGFSGTLLALHLLRRCPPAVRVALIERNGAFGRG